MYSKANGTVRSVCIVSWYRMPHGWKTCDAPSREAASPGPTRTSSGPILSHGW